MQVAGIGRVVFWESGSLWIGRAGAPGDVHAHRAVQLSVGLDGPVTFRGPEGGWKEFAAALVPSKVPHAFGAPGRRTANVLFEPETEAGRALSGRCRGGEIAAIEQSVALALAAPLLAALERRASEAEMAMHARDALASLTGTTPPTTREPDPRIARALVVIRATLDGPVSLARIADAACLSPSRLRHLFVEETGVPFRAYVLWARLNRALELGYGGSSWTEAAHAAGFADSAHLTRTCRRMLGLAPTGMRPEPRDR